MSYEGLGTPPRPALTLAAAAQQAAQQAATYVPPPISAWRRAIRDMLGVATGLCALMPNAVKEQTNVWVASVDPAKRQSVQELAVWIQDPTKPDSDVANKVGEAREAYRNSRQNAPAPVKSMFDPIADAVVGLVPDELKPSSFSQPINVQPVLTESAVGFGVPWLWIGGSFVAGWLTCKIVSKPVTANRRWRHR